MFISLVAFILRFALINEPAEVVYGLLLNLTPSYGRLGLMKCILEALQVIIYDENTFSTSILPSEK